MSERSLIRSFLCRALARQLCTIWQHFRDSKNTTNYRRVREKRAQDTNAESICWWRQQLNVCVICDVETIFIKNLRAEFATFEFARLLWRETCEFFRWRRFDIKQRKEFGSNKCRWWRFSEKSQMFENEAKSFGMKNHKQFIFSFCLLVYRKFDSQLLHVTETFRTFFFTKNRSGIQDRRDWRAVSIDLNVCKLQMSSSVGKQITANAMSYKKTIWTGAVFRPLEISLECSWRWNLPLSTNGLCFDSDTGSFMIFWMSKTRPISIDFWIHQKALRLVHKLFSNPNSARR